MRSRPAAVLTVLALLAVLAVLAAVSAGLAGPAPAQEPGGAVVAARLEDPRIVESSGLALSRRHPGVVWTHNDSGDQARLFAVGSDGRTRAVLTLAGVDARDWEAVAAGRDDRGRPALFAGDIGDNNGVWPEVAVYRVAEPAALGDATVPAVRYRLRYADGPHDAEALLVDPRSNRLYVATKAEAGGGLYRAPPRLDPDGVNVLERVARVPPVVTDGAFLPGGRGFVLRDYQQAHVYTAPGRRVGSLDLPLQFQGESLTVAADGRSVLAGSEGPASDVWRVPLPEAVLARVTPTTRAPATATRAPAARPAAAGGWRWGVTPLLAVAAGSLALLVALLLGRRPRER
jgi:hypothetical protein